MFKIIQSTLANDQTKSQEVFILEISIDKQIHQNPKTFYIT